MKPSDVEPLSCDLPPEAGAGPAGECEPSDAPVACSGGPARALVCDPPARLSPAAIAGFAARPSAAHGGMNVDRFFGLHIFGGFFPAAAAVIFYGWRALALIAATVVSTLLALAVWKRIGPRGRQLRAAHSLWLALLLALSLPAHLMSDRVPAGDAAHETSQGAPAPPAASRHLWAVAPASAILLVMLTWLLGGVGSGRIHPVLVTHLFAVVLIGPAMNPRWVLQRGHAVVGDLFRWAESEQYTQTGWVTMEPVPGADALMADAPAQRLIAYTTATARHEQNWLSLDGLLRDEMPPLEDVIVGAQPGPIGAASGVAVVVGGLFLLYRGVIDFRIPLLASLAAYAAFLVLPVPLVIKESGVAWRWLAMRQPNVSGGAVITFVNYEMMAGPLMFTLFFLATSPAVRPMPRRARVLYAVLVGAAGAALQLYVSVAYGAYLALLIVSLLTPGFDKLFRPRPLA